MDLDGREFLNVEISEKEKKSINKISFPYVNSEIHVTLKIDILYRPKRHATFRW